MTKIQITALLCLVIPLTVFADNPNEPVGPVKPVAVTNTPDVEIVNTTGSEVPVVVNGIDDSVLPLEVEESLSAKQPFSIRVDCSHDIGAASCLADISNTAPTGSAFVIERYTGRSFMEKPIECRARILARYEGKPRTDYFFPGTFFTNPLNAAANEHTWASQTSLVVDTVSNIFFLCSAGPSFGSGHQLQIHGFIVPKE